MTNLDHHPSEELTSFEILGIGFCLLLLTGLLVWVSYFDLGYWNFIISMGLTTLNAFLILFALMGFYKNSSLCRLLMGHIVLFFMMFLGLCHIQGFFVPGKVSEEGQKTSLKNPWIPTPELVTHGKNLYMTQCATCHGAEGRGDGPAASALNPHPRNFTLDAGWMNGRKPTRVFKTLKEGIPASAMASYSTLPVDQRWALVHYVLSLGSAQSIPVDTPADFAAIGLDPSHPDQVAQEETKLPIDFAIQRIEQ